jgi:hypothetical protein
MGLTITLKYGERVKVGSNVLLGARCKGTGKGGVVLDFDAAPEVQICRERAVVDRPPPSRAEAARIVSDFALMLRHFAAGRLRWEPFAHQANRGELCFNGLRHFTTLDADGVPELPGGLRERLMAWKETGA